MGHSAGAYVAAMLTLDPRYLSKVGLHRNAIRATPRSLARTSYSVHGRLPVFAMKPGDPPTPGMEADRFCRRDVNRRCFLCMASKIQTVDSSNATRLAARIEQAGGKVPHHPVPRSRPRRRRPLACRFLPLAGSDP